jgi:[NiFe] hydrogenase diaphorase moiety large subunit
MAICGRAVGATRGLIYLRHEYGWLEAGLRAAIDAAVPADFAIELRLGAGAYICGEETALIASLEGYRGEARNRPPFPTEHGLDGHPTVVNNVETLAWIPVILAGGAEAYRTARDGRGARPRLYSISGDVARPGVYELGDGVTVDDLLRLSGGEGAQAVQVGGASGHLLPPSEFGVPDTPRRAPRGGAVIVYGPDRDLAAMVGELMAFFADESCGQCTPCRLGTRRLERFMDRLAHGAPTAAELDEVRSLCRTMQLTSKCGLGQTAPNALVDLLDRFPEAVPAAARAGREAGR